MNPAPFEIFEMKKKNVNLEKRTDKFDPNFYVARGFTKEEASEYIKCLEIQKRIEQRLHQSGSGVTNQKENQNGGQN